MDVEYIGGTTLNEAPLTERVHQLALALPRHRYPWLKGSRPSSGIYFFFERGETGSLGGVQVERIVRVGTHLQDGNFPKRIRQHYGLVRSLGGNKNGSVFRRHVGGALLVKTSPHDRRIDEWMKQGGASYPEIEQSVSQTLRERFSFSCFAVPRKDDRLLLERGLIALLAQHPIALPSSTWLGRCAISPLIRSTGLWNTQGVAAAPLAMAEYELIVRFVAEPTTA